MTRSGTQFDLSYGDYSATVTDVGATLRQLQHGERPLVVGFDADEIRPAYRGAVLAPWPNRVADGRYTFDGATHQLAITEPDRGNALHGLVAWVRWDVIDHRSDQVVLRHRLVEQPGYPYPLELTVRYLLDADGLHWSVGATNAGETVAPYGCAPHPYLVAGGGRVDAWSLQLPATRYLAVTPDRLLPVSVEPVAGTGFDFATARTIGDTFIDHAFTGLDADADGRSRVHVRSASGQGVAMTWDPIQCPWVQIHTADRPGEPGHRGGLAVEPMTCPPDAFNSGTDVIRLAPGASHEVTWTISAVAGQAETA